MSQKRQYIIGIDEAGRAARRKRASLPLKKSEARLCRGGAQQSFLIGIDEAGRAASKRGKPRPASIIGIDEAGRGPLAGPVVVAGIRIRIKDKGQKIKIFRNIRDSKKLTARRREEWFRILTNHPEIEWAAAKVWPRTIDRINIASAANLGVRRVYEKLCRSKPSFDGEKLGWKRLPEIWLLDGGLKLSPHIPHKVIIKGDEKIPVIAAASIIAKVTRDRLMLRLHKKYPQYGFDAHKGYGTKMHRALIAKFGFSEVHRRSFSVRNF